MNARRASDGLRAILCAALLVLAFSAACAREVGLDVLLPANVVSRTEWIEVGAFRDGSCEALAPKIRGGLPDGYAARVGFKLRPTNEDPAQVRNRPSFGEIPNGVYAFAAVARAEDCHVVAIGCSEIDVGDTRLISIALTEAESPASACREGSVCRAAQCVAANDLNDPSVGAHCSMQLIGAGPLANRVVRTVDPSTVSAPAVAAVPNGFIAAYRETDPSSGRAQYTQLFLDNGAGSRRTRRPLLPNRCPSAEESGIGLVVKGTEAFVSNANAPCEAPWLELLAIQLDELTNVDDDYEETCPASGNFPCVRYFKSPQRANHRITISPAHTAATRAEGSLAVYTDDGVPHVANMVAGDGGGIVPPTGTFGSPASTGAWIATSDKVLALLSSSLDRAADDGGVNEDAGVAPFLRLLTVPAATPLDSLNGAEGRPRPPVKLPGAWGAPAAFGTRVLVLSDADGPNRSATLRVYELGKDEPVASDGFGLAGKGPATAGDIAIQGDRAFLAVLKAGAIGVQVYDNISTNPIRLRTVFFDDESLIPSVSNVRADGKVAIAASETRVAVVWTIAKDLGTNDSTGGYAVFACTK